MPGLQNPIKPALVAGISTFVHNVHNASTAMKDKTKSLVAAAAELPNDQQLVDVSIQFIGASGLPKMDLVGSCDPYFVAKIDDAISFV